MRFLTTACTLVALVYGGGGVTKPSGIDQFWTDDYKIFDQVYGKTSDKDIYGTSLPASITYDGDKKKEASDKKERYAPTYDLDNDSDTDRYNSLITKQPLKSLSKNKPATSTIDFISYSDFKPISQSNVPETYNYLKPLEYSNKEETFEFPKSVGGFKPYLNYAGSNPEDSDAYKSIQNILDAHEANKGSRFKSDDDTVKYITYGKNKKKKPSRVFNGANKSRCLYWRCRKRANGSVRVRSRPIVRRVKHRVVNY